MRHGRLIAALFAGTAALASAPAQAPAQDPRYVFMGDSLVDNRNSFLFTQRILGPAGTVPQSPPYFRGRFSNGPNWTDRLEPTQLFYADYFLSDPACGSGNPAVAASGACDPALDPGVQPGVSMNFAFGGSRSGTDPLLPGAPGLLTVLDDLAGFDATGRVADLEGVHFGVWTGGNDYSNYVAAPGGLSEAQVVDRTLDNIQTGLTRMDGLGADRALVLNLFDLSRIPTFVNVLGRAGADQAGRLSRAHNAALGGRLAQVRRTTGLDLVLVDVAALYDDIYRVPGRYGFTNLTQGCIDETTLLPTGACAAPSSPDAALYWDGTHPTEAAHAQIHALVAATLQAVDEDGGRLLALPDSGLVQVDGVLLGARAQLDSWRSDTAEAAGPAGAGAGARNADMGRGRVYVLGAAEAGQRAEDGDFAGYDYRGGGGLVGIGYRPEGLQVPALIGVHAGAVRLDSDIAGGGSFETTGYGGGLLAGVRLGRASLSAQATALRLNLDGVERDTGFPVYPTASSETQGWAFGGELEGRLDFDLELDGEVLWLSPLTRLGLTRAELDGYREQGARFLNLDVEGSSETSLTGAVGLAAHARPSALGGAMPYGSLTYERVLDGPDRDLRGQLPSGQAIRADGGPGPRDRVRLDAGIRIPLGARTTLDTRVAAGLATDGDQAFVMPMARFVTVF
jgi:outer membrane lipase/esterase